MPSYRVSINDGVDILYIDLENVQYIVSQDPYTTFLEDSQIRAKLKTSTITGIYDMSHSPNGFQKANEK